MEQDIDQNLLQQFSCMGTRDKDDLVRQMQLIIGFSLGSRTAAFFLEMNNWNLQGALGSYFDAANALRLPSMALIRNNQDVEEETRVHPGTAFWKTRDVQNIGEEPWPPGCCLVFSGGVLMSPHDRIPVISLMPGCTTTLRIDMVAPEQPGIYESKWRMSTSSGSYFGDVIWIIVTVADQSLSGLTQQLSSLSSLGSMPLSNAAPNNVINPFNTTSQNLTSQSEMQSGGSMDEDGNMLC